MTPDMEHSLEDIRPRIVKSLQRACISVEEAEDIVQDTLLYLLESGRLARWDANGPATLFTYIYRACLRRLSNARRDQTAERTRLAASTVQTLLSCGDLLEGLSPEDTQLLRLRYWGGLTLAEMGTHYGKSRGEMAKQLRKAECTLRKLLTQGRST